MSKKLTKNVSISSGGVRADERRIVDFTKPFKYKNYYVVVTKNVTRNLYEVRGIDVFNLSIRKDVKSYDQAMHIFYEKLCWMINPSRMEETACQRNNPEHAYLNN